jgi:hypothetical protein
MQLQRGTQSQGFANRIVVKGVQYQASPTGKSYNRATYNFDSLSEWQTGTVAGGTTLAPITQIGTQIYTGISSSIVDLNTFKNYNPLTTTSRSTSLPSYLLNNQHIVKTLNVDSSNRTQYKFTAKGSTVNDILIVRYYTGTGVADYYQVICQMPLPNVEYTFAFNPFINGTYGVAGTPTVVGTKQFASGSAVVSTNGAASGQTIARLAISATSTSATSKITPIAFEGTNNSLNQWGTKFQIPVCCIKDITEKLDRKYIDLICGKDVSGQYLDSQKESIKFVMQKNNLLLRALGYSSEVYDRVIDVPLGPIKLNLTTTGTNIVANVSGDIQMSVAKDTNIDYIAIDKGGDCIALQRDYIHNTTATLDPNMYYVDLANNTIIFSNEIYNYGEVEVFTRGNKLASVFDHYTEQNPTKVILEWVWTNVKNDQSYLRRVVAELGYPKDKVDKGGNTTEFDCDVILTDYEQSIEAVY